MLVLIDSELNEDGTKFNPEADEEVYCNKYNKALNDNEIVGGVVVESEPSYDDDEYKWINYKDIIYNGIYKLWCSVDVFCLLRK